MYGVIRKSFRFFYYDHFAVISASCLHVFGSKQTKHRKHVRVQSGKARVTGKARCHSCQESNELGELWSRLDFRRSLVSGLPLKIFSLSLQIRFSSWEICSQRQVSLQFHHLVGCYHPKTLKIERRQKTKLREKQSAYFHDSFSRRHFDSSETLPGDSSHIFGGDVMKSQQNFSPGLKFLVKKMILCNFLLIRFAHYKLCAKIYLFRSSQSVLALIFRCE